MADTHDVGRLFWHTIEVRKGTKPVHRARTVEVEYPFRKARPWVIRLFRRRALVVGWWVSTDWDEDRALLEAMYADPVLLDFANEGEVEEAVRNSRGEWPDLGDWRIV